MNRELVRYGVHSVGGFACNLGVLALLVELISVPESVAPIASTAIILLVFFPVADSWVFNERNGSKLSRFGAYVSVLAGAKALSYVGYLGLLVLGWHYLAAWIVASGAVFLASYGAHRVTRGTLDTDGLTNAIRRRLAILQPGK